MDQLFPSLTVSHQWNSFYGKKQTNYVFFLNVANINWWEDLYMETALSQRENEHGARLAKTWNSDYYNYCGGWFLWGGKQAN